MPESKLKVVLLNYTPNPVFNIAKSARLSHFGKSIKELDEIITPEYANELVKRLIGMGHESTLEHVTFTFGIEGISRACSHQLVRHRIASYTQQSQRYVNEKDFDYIVPPAVKENKEALEIFENHMKESHNTYKKLVEFNIIKEDARFVLPNACETKIICTFDMRSLRNFFNLRISRHAQWEIREMAKQMFYLVKETAPVFVEDLEKKLYFD